jgi:hypothetical protein
MPVDKLVTLEEFCKDNGIKYERYAQHILNGEIKSADFLEIFNKWNITKGGNYKDTDILMPALWHIKASCTSKNTVSKYHTFLDEIQYKISTFQKNY